MAIFGNIGRKITDAGQSVAQQTKDLAEVTKLNNQISGMEKKQNELFLALGRACYEQQKDDGASENRELLDKIREAYEQIDALNERIKQIKGYEKCPRCGADVASDALFCSACGLKIERGQQTQDRQMFCMSCGARFCIVCGAPVESAGQAAEESAPAEEGSAGEPAEEPVLTGEDDAP